MIKNIVNIGLPVLETLHIKKNTLTNGNSSKRISIVSGIYGDELDGQYICYRLNEILQNDIENLCGTIDIYPVINPLGLESIRRGVPSFDLDINRSFPGNPTGNMLEYLTSKIVEDIKGTNLCIDLHSSNIFLREIPQVRIREEYKERLLPYAKLLNCDFIWIHSSATVENASLAYALNAIDIPTLAIEMGVGMRITKKYGDQVVEGILYLLHELGVWNGETKISRDPIISSDGEVSLIHAEASGIFIPSIEHWKGIKKNELVGKIVNSLTGAVEEELYSPSDGMVFTLREYPVVYSGSIIARILGGTK